MPEIKYPFVPKSTRWLMPGHFWALPLSDGTFGCGRVITLKKKENGGVDSRAFLAGVLDWHGTQPPSFESIAGRPTFDQGHVHIKTILETGGLILGYRPLELDHIESNLFLDQGPCRNCLLLRGFEKLRIATTEEQASLPVLSTWGYMVIKGRAERKFVR